MPCSRLIPRRRSILVFCLGWLAFWSGAPSRAQELFRERRYRVRIAVAEKVRRVVLQGMQNAVVSSDGLTAIRQIKAGEPYFVDIVEGQPGAKTYRLVLRELDSHQVDTAIDLAKQAKEAYRLPVKVFRIPSREQGDGRILVTLGEFPTLDEARERVRQLKSEQVSLIYEDRAAAVQGQVRLFDKNGTILARDARRLRVSSADPGDGDLTVEKIAADNWSAANLASARRYRGDLDLMMNEEGTLTVVNDLWVEHYLYSVVAAEIGDDAPVEALKAQAVAGRSEAVAKIERHIVSSTLFDFYDTAIAQSYPGRKVETENVRQAVDATRGEILVWRGQPVDAVYSHSCGGYLASSRDLWDDKEEGYSERRLDRLASPDPPDLSSWKSSYDFLRTDVPALCNPEQRGFPDYARKYFRWKKTFTGAEYSRLANTLYHTGAVKDIYIDARTPSGRVRRMRIVGADRTVTIDHELEIRNALGDIYSTFFALVKDRDENGMLRSLRIDGGGFGHGVGMCQMGALMMAKRGYNYRQILAHYYSDVKIRRLYR